MRTSTETAAKIVWVMAIGCMVVDSRIYKVN